MLFSTGQIAQEIDEDRDAVAYAIRKAGIKPIGRAGLVRLFPQSAIDAVKDFIKTKRHSNRAAQHNSSSGDLQ